MLSKPIKDCGCGGGKSHCITKPENTFRAWVREELKRLDCGCGCQGRKAFTKKYGKLVGGAILADCPPGWRNDGLTCVENCKPDERDDGLTCRKKCDPGWVDDGLTCRKPITSSMNSCPAGSRDIAGTCWGPVRKDCIDDCFKHPAPGCKTWQCGRLRGLFGEDWGPKLCTSCNLRCGQTCWDVQGITKQLHQRELKVSGGEVIGQAIRGKQIRGRVNWNELGKVMEQGVKDLLEGNIDLAAAFDPERNGVNAAFRKFGSDINKALNEIEKGIKAGFEKMGADAKRAFEQLAKDAEKSFKQFGADLVAKLKDPDFWVEFAAIMTEVALYAAATLATATGVGAAFAPGLLAAAAMAGPSIRMIGNAAQGRPIDAMDIVELVAAGASAAIPGLSGVTQTIMKGVNVAAKVTITVVKAGQALGMIPSTCLGPNCPPPPNTDFTDPPLDPKIPGDPPPEGQLTDEEIEALQPEHTVKSRGGKNPDYISRANWIAQYRAEHYGTDSTQAGTGAIISKEDKTIEEATEIRATDPPTEIPDAEELFPNFPAIPESTDFPSFGDDFSSEFPAIPESSDFPAIPESSDFPSFGDDFSSEFPAIPESSEFPTIPESTDFPAIPESTDFLPIEASQEVIVPEYKPEAEKEPVRIISEEELESDSFIPRAIIGGMRGGTNIEDLPIIDVNINGDEYSNPWGEMKSTLPKSTTVIPLTHTGANFDPTCYARHNPDVASAVGNDKDKLTTHWIEVGSKEGLNADCGNTPSTLEQRLAGMVEFEKQREKFEGMKTNCKATDRFWIENENKCDGHRHADGRPNLDAAQCIENNSHWNSAGPNSFCNPYLLPNNNWKSQQEICNLFDNFWDGSKCIETKNVDGSQKTKADVCTALNGFWNGTNCDVTKDRDNKALDNKKICNNVGNFWGRAIRIFEAKYRRRNWDVTIDITNEIRKELKIRTVGGVEEVYLPSLGTVKSLASKYGLRDIDPYKEKFLTIKWFDGIKNQDVTHGENRNVEALNPVANAPIECMTEYHPGGIANSNEYRANVRTFVTFPIDQNQKTTAYNRIANQVGSGKPKSLTLYWAEWCPHCHDLMPEWEKLGDGYKGIKIEAIEEQDSNVKVNGYPTIIYRDGKNIEKYEGERSKTAILNFLKNKLSMK